MDRSNIDKIAQNAGDRMLLAKLWGPQAFNSESPPAYTLTELTMITRAGMVICLTMICETVASFIFAYALRIEK